jgi:hypothetical protein
MNFTKNGGRSISWAVFILLGWGVLAACTHGRTGMDETRIDQQSKAQKTYLLLDDALPRDQETIDYDTLMKIHHTICEAEGPIPHLDDILGRLIAKTNPNPRVDNMILIVAAAAIGDSQYPIENASRLFESLLDQDPRLNSWVLAYVADALGKYPVDLPDGDHLADVLEEKVDYHVRQSHTSREFFGYHFLPPPKSDYIRDYLAGISDKRIRVSERNCYYLMVGHGLTEDQVETALRQIRELGLPETGEKTDRPMKALIRHWNQFFSGIERAKVPKPKGL